MRYLEAVVFVVVVSAGALLAAYSTPSVGGRLEYLAIGVLFGTLFSHATLAAAWTALGPGKLVYRLPLSLAWLAALCIGFSLNIAMFGGPSDVFILVVGCLAGQWIITQIPLWVLSIGYGARVRNAGRPSSHVLKKPNIGLSSLGESQFGIRQLIVITFIIGVVLGVGRAVVLQMARRFTGFGGEAPIFIFIAVAGMLMTLPLILAALLPRRALIGVLIVLALIAVGTAWELPLMSRMTSAGGPDFWHFALMNGFQVAWILGIAVLLRMGGYRLQGRASPVFQTPPRAISTGQ